MGCLKLYEEQSPASLQVVFKKGDRAKLADSCFLRVDYYPFGQPLPGLSFNSTGYKYGFNGKEKLDEINVNGGDYDFGARIYDSRTGRFLSTDPLFKNYAWLAPYAFAANSPIKFIDVDGEGPGDRVKAAKQLIGKAYSNKAENTGTAMRCTYTKEALAKQDCIELVCRVMKADGITEKVEYYLARKTSVGKLLNNTQLFEHSASPKVGDIAFWEGHVGVVSSVDANGKFKLVHAANEKYGVLENGYHINADQYRSSEFYGFYRPVKETPDGKKIDMFHDNGNEPTAQTAQIAKQTATVSEPKQSTATNFVKYVHEAGNYYKQAKSMYDKAAAETDEDFKVEFNRKGDELTKQGDNSMHKARDVNK